MLNSKSYWRHTEGYTELLTFDLWLGLENLGLHSLWAQLPSTHFTIWQPSCFQDKTEIFIAVFFQLHSLKKKYHWKITWRKQPTFHRALKSITYYKLSCILEGNSGHGINVSWYKDKNKETFVGRVSESLAKVLSLMKIVECLQNRCRVTRQLTMSCQESFWSYRKAQWM